MKWLKKLIAAIVVLLLYSGIVAIVASAAGWSFTEAIVHGLVIAGVVVLGVLLSVGLALLFDWVAD